MIQQHASGGREPAKQPQPKPSREAGALWLRRNEGQERTPWFALVSLMALAAVLRIIGLDDGLWWDEIRTLVDSVRHPLAQIVTEFPRNNQHTFYSVLAHISIGLFGEEPWSLRLPALLFGVATPPLLYFAAREFTGRREALLAGLLLTVSYHHVWFSQSARGYSAMAFFALLSSWLLLRGLRRGKASDFVCYGAACALGAYTHLTMVFVPSAHAVACALLLGVPGFDKTARRRWRLPAVGFMLAAACTLALYEPLLSDVGQFFLKDPAPKDKTTALWATMELFRGLQLGTATALGAPVAGALFICGLWSYFRQSRFLLALFVLPGVFAVAATLALGRPIFPRFLFFLAGFGVLILVRGALEFGAWLSRKWRADSVHEPVTTSGIALVALLTALSAATLPLNYRYPKQDFAGAMQFVQTQRAVGEPVVTAGGAIYPYQEYYRLPWEGVASRAELQTIRGDGRRVWVLHTLARNMEAGAPELMQTLRDECSVAGLFRGTVADGDVTVCILPPMNKALVSPPIPGPR